MNSSARVILTNVSFSKITYDKEDQFKFKISWTPEGKRKSQSFTMKVEKENTEIIEIVRKICEHDVIKLIEGTLNNVNYMGKTYASITIDKLEYEEPVIIPSSQNDEAPLESNQEEQW